jgi:hypothetical protein
VRRAVRSPSSANASRALEPAAHARGGARVATLSVAFWWLTERAGQGDLRLYLFVQMLPMILVTLGLGWASRRRRRRRRRRTPGGRSLLWYAAAKVVRARRPADLRRARRR